MSWKDLVNQKMLQESFTHPHCPEEKAELFFTFDVGSTEVESLELLHAIIRRTKPQMCLETGTFCGIGTIAIAHALFENGRGKLISLEKNINAAKRAQERIKNVGLESFAEIKNIDSLEFCSRTTLHFDFAFFDSATPIRVEEFYKLYHRNKLLNIVAFHDTSKVREKSFIVEGESQKIYLEKLKKIKSLCKIIDFPLARGLILGQVNGYNN